MRTTKKTILGMAITTVMVSQGVLAQSDEQRVRIEVEQIDGAQYRGSVYYSTSNQALTTGIGYRLYYSTEVVQDFAVGDTYDGNSLFLGEQIMPDTNNDDNDPATDSFLNIGWANLNGNFPESIAETRLQTFTFNLADPGSPTDVAFNFTLVTAGNGYTFAPSNFSARLPDINEAPAGTDNTININEDRSYALTADDFGFTDPNDDPANNFIAVRITTLPTAGSLTLNGAAVTAGQEVPVANLPRLVFTPADNAHGLPYSSFTFQVKDDGGVDPDDVDLDITPNTITFNVVSSNDAPGGASNTVTLLEDASYAFVAGDFGFSDNNDTPPDALQAVILTTLPAQGALTLGGASVTAGQAVPAAQIGTLVYTPPTNAEGAMYTSFTFQVQDDGGIANDGVDTDPVTGTLTLNVTGVNDAPVGTSRGISMLEGGILTFAASDFGFSDPDDVPPDALDAVIITTLPAQGTLTLDGSGVTAGQAVPAAQIGTLVYTPPGGALGVNYASFTFQVRDDGGTANGGQNLDADAETITISITDINSAPSGADNTVTINENSSRAFVAGDFGFSDTTDDPANQLLAVRIESLPVTGSLTLGGNLVAAGQSIPAASLTNLVFTPSEHGKGDNYASFTFRVQDDGGTQDGGADLDLMARTLTINVAAVNSAPSGTSITLSINEDAAYTMKAGDFGFSDPDDQPGDSFMAVRIASLPAAGTFTLDGNPVVAGQDVPLVDLPDLVFTPAANASGVAYASFSFQVQDNGGVADGGIDLDPTSKTVTFDVLPVNDRPVATDVTLTVYENSFKEFSAADFGFSDPNDTPADNLLAVRIDTLPLAGLLTFNGTPVAQDDYIPAEALAGLRFTPEPHQNGDDYASMTFTVRDDGGSENGGLDESLIPNTIVFDVTPANSAPSGADNTVIMFEGGTFTFEADDFGFSDADDIVANTLSAVRITTLPALGSLRLNDEPVTAGQSIELADLGNLTYAPAAHGNGDEYASFTFQVQDNGGTAEGGIDLDATPKTFTFDVTPVNSAPSGSNRTVTVPEGGEHDFAVANFGFTDSNDNPANTLLEVLVVTLPAQGELTLNGQPVAAGEAIPEAELGLLVYTPPANAFGQPYTSFTFRVRDNGGVENDGIDTDPTPKTLTLNVGFAPEPPPTTTPPPSQPDPGVTETINELNEELDAIVVEAGQPVSQEVEAQVSNALERTNALAEQVVNNLPQGNAGVTQALSALDTLSKTLTVTSDIVQQGGQVATSSVVNSIKNVANVLTAMSDRTENITPQQRATVQALTSATITNSDNLIRQNATTDDLIAVVAATSAVINAATGAGAELSGELVAQAEALVTKAIKTGMASFAADIDAEDPAQIENLLRTNPEALEFAISTSVAVKSRIKPDTAALEAELSSRGAEGAVSESLSNVLNGVSNPDGIQVGDTSASGILLSALVQFLSGGTEAQTTQDGRQLVALTAGNIELTVDPLTGTVMIGAPGETYSGTIINTRIVSPSVPDGMSYLRDGRLLLVTQDLAIELAPIAADLISFTTAIEQEGYTLTLRDGAAVDITLSATERFVGVFAYDNIVGASSNCGAVSVVAPSGPLNSPGYAFGIHCADGTQQKVLPFVHDSVFYRAVADLGLRMSTDRNTGIINIPGVGLYKPGFFVNALTASDQAFYEANKDARGVAFRFVDLDGNGLEDVIFMTAAGAQSMYRVAQ